MNGLTPREQQTLQDNPSAELSASVAYMPKMGPSGVGGWLLLLVAGCFIGPIILALSFLTTLSALSRSPDFTVSPSAVMIFVAVALYVGMSLWAGLLLVLSRKKSAVSTVVQALWVSGPIAMGIFWWILPKPSIPLGTVAASAILTALWTAYLLKSRRVRNTYSLGGHE